MIKKRKKFIYNSLIIVGVLLIIVVFIYGFTPSGRIFKGEVYNVPDENIDFLYDLTYKDDKGNLVYEHEIFNKVYEMVDNAEKFIILDMFLFGSTDKPVYRNLTQELTDKLVNKKNNKPDIEIYFITDYFNVINNYKGEHLYELEDLGINIIFSSPNKKQDLGEKDLINYFFKINKKRLDHRKLIITDKGDKIASLITSANPHDMSSANSNIGIYIEDKIWRDIYGVEKKEGLISNEKIEYFFENVSDEVGEISVQYFADEGLLYSLKNEIDKSIKGDFIEIAVFLLSDKKVIEKLLSASKRGVDIKIILDTNENYFGVKKFGVPNKPVAEKLFKGSDGKIAIRWYDSQGEQFHTKLAVFKRKDNKNIILMGSSNFARNNIINYNLQSDVKILADSDSLIMQEVDFYFNMIWFNQNRNYTADFNEFRDKSFYKKLTYEREQIFKKFF